MTDLVRGAALAALPLPLGGGIDYSGSHVSCMFQPISLRMPRCGRCGTIHRLRMDFLTEQAANRPLLNKTAWPDRTR
jgi:hypothetical protein